jgi:hypothetical protein
MILDRFDHIFRLRDGRSKRSPKQVSNINPSP